MDQRQRTICLLLLLGVCAIQIIDWLGLFEIIGVLAVAIVGFAVFTTLQVIWETWRDFWRKRRN